jgi:hypothetical protein
MSDEAANVVTDEGEKRKAEEDAGELPPTKVLKETDSEEVQADAPQGEEAISAAREPTKEDPPSEDDEQGSPPPRSPPAVIRAATPTVTVFETPGDEPQSQADVIVIDEDEEEAREPEPVAVADTTADAASAPSVPAPSMESPSVLEQALPKGVDDAPASLPSEERD